jgi:hypothetical protein
MTSPPQIVKNGRKRAEFTVALLLVSLRRDRKIPASSHARPRLHRRAADRRLGVRVHHEPELRADARVHEVDAGAAGLAHSPASAGRISGMAVDLFPCPFCRSPHVTQTGGGEKFAHYKCSRCAEVWTAQTAAASARRRDRVAELRVAAQKLNRKILLH